MKLSIVVPCYNEAESIPFIFQRFKDTINRDDIEVIIVNNGSTDHSQQVMESLLNDYPFVHIERVELNRGYGYGIIQGLKSAKGEFLAWTHADMQTDPYDVIKALEIVEKADIPEKTYIKGNRQKRPITDAFFTLGMSIFETIYLGTPMNDINAQPNLFHNSFYKTWKNPPYDFSLDLYAYYTARKQKLNIIRFPVFFKERMYGSSHWNVDWKSKLKFIKRTISFSKKLKKAHRS